MILVVCEGQVTEPEYVQGFKAAHGINTVRVVVESPGGDPLGLVQKAIDRRDKAADEAGRAHDDYLVYDDVWCVFDIDQHQRLATARSLAEKNGIRLAVSNPCFELWLLLHFGVHTRPASPTEVSRSLRKHLSGYDKHFEFDRVAPGYAEAVRRATALERHHSELGQEGGNPSTSVFRLTEHLRQFGKSARL